MNRDDGGPAFPHSFTNESVGDCRGMTLRDYFAAEAMPVLATEFYSQRVGLVYGTVPDLAAKVAYEYADAMLKARAS